jgi:peptide/nickel transport system permease protein
MSTQISKHDDTTDASGAADVDRLQTLGWAHFVRALLRDRIVLVSATFLLLLVFCAIFAQWVAPFDPLKQNLFTRLVPPLGSVDVRGTTQFHLLGTDQLGRDMLSRLIHGASVSLSVGLLGAIVSGAIGITLGLVAGFYEGWIENIIMRFVDGFMAIPSLLTALFILFLLGPGFFNLILVFAIIRWMVYARVTRSLVIKFRGSTMVESARAIGAGNGRIIFLHLLPNLASPLISLFTLEVAILIIAEASLSFLGFGIQPPEPSWGGMIASGREYITEAWWLVALPGFSIFFTALSLNLVASWLRSVTDPELRWRWML